MMLYLGDVDAFQVREKAIYGDTFCDHVFFCCNFYATLRTDQLACVREDRMSHI